MSQVPSYAAAGASPVQQVLLVDLYERLLPDYQFEATSLPGHLIQLVIQGRTEHEANGRRYSLRPGSLIWYHEDETVRGRTLQAPWRFYTLNFHAPQLAPPSFEQRVRQVGAPVRRIFQQLLHTWRDTKAGSNVRSLRVQAYVLLLLSHLQPADAQDYVMDSGAALWWNLETQLRRDLSQQISLGRMTQMTGKSAATIARAAYAAVHMPPLKRMKQVRLSLARGLVLGSDLSIKQIADRVGYGRIHEFSRDYRKYFDQSPRQQRRSQ